MWSTSSLRSTSSNGSRDEGATTNLRAARIAARPHPRPVERRPEQVGTEVGDPVDAIPSLPQLQEGVLHQIRGVGPVPGHEVQELEEAPVLVGEERREVQVSFLRHRELDDVALCLHVTRRDADRRANA